MKWATANDLVTFLIRFINDNLNRLEIGDFNFRIATNSEHLRKIHQRLIDTYKNLKKDLKYDDKTGEFLNKDMKHVYDNGTITNIQDH